MLTLGGAGFSSILDKTKPVKDQEGNHRVYYLFEGATNDGSASHIVRGHKEERDGRAAWYALKDWYEGKMMKQWTRQAISCRREKQHKTGKGPKL